MVHTAARVSDWGPMDDFVRVNVGGTRNVLDAAARAGCQRVVHVSSVATWGYEHRDALDEDAAAATVRDPLHRHQGRLRRARAGARARGEPVAVVRPGDVYGPARRPGRCARSRGIKRRRFMLIGKGEGLITPVYVDDLVESIVLALTTPGARARRSRSGTGSRSRCAEFFGHYARMLGRERHPAHAPCPGAVAAGGQEPSPASPGSRRCSPATRSLREPQGALLQPPRARAARLGAEGDLREGMKRTEAWFREEGLLPIEPERL